MAGITTKTAADPTLHRRDQLSAIADLRWRMFVNGLRSKRGKMELFSRIVVTTAFAVAGFGGFTLSSGLSWYFVSQGKAEWLPFLLWPIFFFWQLFPVMSTAFTNNPDSSDLLRFPLTYQSYFLIRLAYGLCDPASALGSLALFGIFLGVSFARPSLFPWTVLALASFALFNLVLQQTIFAWLERWLAQRRTREIMGVLFFLFMLSFQLIGPIMGRMGNKPQPELERVAAVVTQVQAVLPPGLAAATIAQASHTEYIIGFADWIFLAALTAAIGSLLHLRLRAQFRGENLSEAGARPVVAEAQELQRGWRLPGLSQTVAAVFEKEVRYLARSGPMLLTLIMPVFVLLVFRLGPMNQLRHGPHTLSREMALPAAAAYVMLVLTNLVYNSFGGDAGGIQFFYASPAHFRQIVLGKNLLHAAIVVANTAFAWIAITFFYGAPKPAVAFATIAGLLFAAPINFAAGNLLSIYAPRKRDFSSFGRQNVSQTTVLASLGVQLVIVAFGVAAFSISRLYKNPWIAPVEFLVLAAISIPFYVMVLRRMDGIALKRRETLIAELCRA